MRSHPLGNHGLGLTLQYLGERFDGHTLSCADAQDMAIFQRMLVKIANRKINSAGKEGLRGASVKDAVYFGFESISEGSAMVEISVKRLPGNPRAEQAFADFGLDVVSCVEDAFRLLMEIFKGSQDEESFELFKVIKSDIKRFGRNLKGHESIRFPQSKKYTGTDVFFGPEMRGKLAESYNSPNRVAGTGTVTGFKLNGTMFVRSEGHGDFSCKIPPNAVKVELNGHIGSEIEFILTAEINHHGKIGQVKKCHYYELTTKQEDKAASIERAMQRLDSYRSYEKGWYDGEGEKIDPASIETAKKFIQMTPELAHMYGVIPDPEGFVGIEFVNKGWSICMDFSGGGIRVFGFDLADMLNDFERRFKKVDSKLVEFIFTANGNTNAA